MKLANDARVAHGAPCAKWSPFAARYAAAQADINIKNQTDAGTLTPLVHGNIGGTDGVPQMGQNLYMIEGPPMTVPQVAVTGTQSWLGEEPLYIAQTKEAHAQGQPAHFDEKTGHFTQVVWKSSVGVGCKVSQGPFSRSVLACNYLPAGNYAGEFSEEVAL